MDSLDARPDRSPLRFVCRPLVPGRQHWTRGQPHDSFGHTAQEDVLEPRTAMGTHDDEINVALLSDAYNRVCRVSGSDFDFPCPVERIRHEVTELRQRCLVGITAHHGRFRQRTRPETTTGDRIKAALGWWLRGAGDIVDIRPGVR